MKYSLTLFVVFFVIACSFKGNAGVLHELSTSKNEYNFNVSSKYDRAVFARSENNFKNAKVLQVLIDQKGNFGSIETLKLGPSHYKYSDPMLGHGGKTLYFITDRPIPGRETHNDYNIWQASLIKNQWTNISPLPDEINSLSDELGPEMHNGVLYFSSSKNGHLSLYQAEDIGSSLKVSLFEPLSKSTLSQSDLTFSPNGKIALFWQSTIDKSDTQLMMMRKVDGIWQKPIVTSKNLSSPYYEFTPQFSPDGQEIYFSSASPQDGYEGLNIHKIKSELVFPKSWFEDDLGNMEIDLLLPRSKLGDIKTFSYDLIINSEGKRSIESYWVSFEPFELCKQSEGRFTWTDGKHGFQFKNTGKVALTKEQTEGLNRSIRYNFIHMLKQPSTKFFQQYSGVSEFGRLVRANVFGLDDFSLLLNNDLTKIDELRYDDGAVGIEYEYQKIQDMSWPMKFDFYVDNSIVAKGEFANVRLNETSKCTLRLNGIHFE